MMPMWPVFASMAGRCTPNVGYDWSRTPYVAEIPKSEFVTGQNTFYFPAAPAGYHIHDIAVRIYFDAGHPLKSRWQSD